MKKCYHITTMLIVSTLVWGQGNRDTAISVYEDETPMSHSGLVFFEGNTPTVTMTYYDTDGGTPQDLSGFTGLLTFSNRDGGQTVSGSVDQLASGIIVFAFDTTDTGTPGKYTFDIKITDGTNTEHVMQGRLRIRNVVSVTNTNTLGSLYVISGVFSQDTAGTVSGPTAAEIAANKVLQADNTWVDNAGGGSTAINDITDVTITTPADNEVLAFDNVSGDWINQTPAEAGLSGTSHNHSGVYQPLDDELTDIAGLTPTDSSIIVGTGAAFATESGATARTSLGLSIGTDVQAYDEELGDVAGLTPGDGNIIIGSGPAFITESGATARASLGLIIGTDIAAQANFSQDTAGLVPGPSAAEIAANEVLRADGTWVPQSGGASAFDDLSDVDLTGAANNDLLFRSAGNWIDTAGILTWDGATLLNDLGSDAVGLQVEADASQTADILKITNSAGSNLVSVESDGRMVFGGASPGSGYNITTTSNGAIYSYGTGTITNGNSSARLELNNDYRVYLKGGTITSTATRGLITIQTVAGNRNIEVVPHGTGSLDVQGGIIVERTATAVATSSAAETIIGVTDTSAPRTITLDTDDVIDGRIIIINDESGAAGTNNITIATEATETIDGSATQTISTNYGVLRVYSDGTNWFTF